ncbi:MAG TPA: hypothetical protein VGO48_10755 [Conexibacter sp.]|nr:hypothetical protein [Conexibacter sp.]
MSVLAEAALAEVLHEIALGAGEREQAPVPAFPHRAFDALGHAGVLAWGVQAGAHRPPAGEELALVRRVAAADGSVGRILDGHLNALERLAVQAPPEVRERELDAVLRRGLRAGVWGADPVGEEGEPAAVHAAPGGLVLRGVKVFCSGAGGLQRALVLARDAASDGPPLAAWVDVGDRDLVEVDPTWFRGAGLRASVSHRVVFHDASVIALLGGPGALSEQPWFARDALRTAASWAGMADTAAAAALHELAARPPRGQLEELAAGRIATAQRTIDLWVREAARAMDAARDDDAIRPLRAISVHARDAIASACRALLDEAARACGSRPFATAGSLDRARRDLELFLLQHRLDPLLARAGAERLDGR